MSLLVEIKETLTPAKETSAEILLVASDSVSGILFLWTLGKFSMLFLSKSDRDAKLVTPS